MEIKFILLTQLLTLQYRSCLDQKNCLRPPVVHLKIPPRPTMKFYLYTNKNFDNEQQVFNDNIPSLYNSNFSPEWPVRFIIHGWKNFLNSCVNGYIKDAYLKKGNFNVFVVDWSDWARHYDYLEVVPHVFYSAGPLLAEFIKFLTSYGRTFYSDIYLIGHDLGAHVAGSAGLNLLPNKVHTIYALDPAARNFQNNTPSKRLDSSQAEYVEQITTNMGEYGYMGLIGHAAFYPNYGRKQNYCLFNRKNDQESRFCNHYTSYRYFAETITSQTGFCASECSFNLHLQNQSISGGYGCPEPDCKVKILMGGEPSKTKTGEFYLRTKNIPPFARCKCEISKI